MDWIKFIDVDRDGLEFLYLNIANINLYTQAPWSKISTKHLK